MTLLVPAKKRVRRRKKRRSRYHRGEHVSPKSPNVCRFRSGWELRYMQHLDADPNVVSYEYEALVIPYVSNVRTGKMRKYLPDLVVRYADGRVEVVEIKQSRKVHTPPIVKKSRAARDWCAVNGATYVMVTEVELRVLGLL